ncbi:MAG: ABC transporter substrate-binding protein [Chloroflexi bacterium]|nr:ABC transporter substrate-binding protein [Chloroflexota bacterium]
MRKILWLAASGVMILSLVMAACGPTTVVEERKPAPATEEKKASPAVEEKKQEVVAEKEAVTTKDNTVKLTLTKLDGTKIEKTMEKPKYGGTHTFSVTSDSGEFDPAFGSGPAMQPPLGYSVLLGGDWTRGPAGTNETFWGGDGNYLGKAGLYRYELAESYEILDAETIRFKIREGVHFALDPNSAASRLVNGRELTAADVVWSWERQWSNPRSYHYLNMPTDRPVSIKALDKYTIEYKVKPNTQGLHLIQVAGRLPVIPHEVVEKYGDMKDWRNVVVPGPFMLADYVAGSSRTYIKNPNYFAMDPWFPENRLPYIDVIKRLVLPDASTRQAALRTGKIDLLGLSWEDAVSFKKSNPQIRQTKSANYARTLVGRMDKPELPWGPQDDPNALKVRRALNLAINKQEMIDNYYGGNAELFAFPWPPTSDFEGIYRPLSTYPEEVQELFQYKPDKAKQLLKEAGYPNGFKATVTIPSTDVDFAAILKDYLGKVGVDLVIDVRDATVMSALKGNERSYPEMVIDINREHQSAVRMNGVRKEATWDYAFFEHPVTRAAYNEANLWLMKDDAKVAEAWRSINDTYLQVVKEVMLPMPYSYQVWWPWLQRWEGASNIGSWRSEAWVDWIWIDSDLKKSMGY